MRELTLFLALLTVLSAQSISYDSVFCTSFIENYTPEEMWPKYQKMVENLNNDTSLKAQQARVTRFINRNWKGLWGAKNKHMIEEQSQHAKKQVEARWQMVGHLKEILAGLKPHLTNSEFEKTEKLLWDTDESAKQNVEIYYFNWKRTVTNMMSSEARRQEIIDFFIDWEQRADFTTFENNQMYWNSGIGYGGCF